jgi:hypothetical protein
MEICGGLLNRGVGLMPTLVMNFECRATGELSTNGTGFNLFHIGLHHGFSLQNPELTAIFEFSVSSTNY